jgi:hypothetical protein
MRARWRRFQVEKLFGAIFGVGDLIAQLHFLPSARFSEKCLRRRIHQNAGMARAAIPKKCPRSFQGIDSPPAIFR